MLDPRLKGHLAQRERLLARLQAGRIRGSLLFTGPEGIGKRRVALELAQREVCFRKTACGACEGCKAYTSDPLPTELPNLLRIAPEGKAGVIKIGVIRDSDLVEGGVIQWASLAPPHGCHRWILIEDAHRLNGASANILLKMLEEPPPGTHFILVTHRPEAVLQTIRSRCERIPFAPLGEAEAWAVAEAAGWAPTERERWSALAAGSLRLLDREAFDRAEAQALAWLALAEGAPFQEAVGPLLPDRDSDHSLSEQLRQPLELLLALLADLERERAGTAGRMGPWGERLKALGASGLQVKEAQEAVYEVLRNLARNPVPEPLVREVALALRPLA